MFILVSMFTYMYVYAKKYTFMYIIKIVLRISVNFYNCKFFIKLFFPC